MPAVGLISKNGNAKNLLLVLSALIIAALIVREFLAKQSKIMAPRGNPGEMAHPRFYEKVQRDVVGRRLSDIEDMADGILRVFGSDVRAVSVTLFHALAESTDDAKQVYATDLTSNPDILKTRQDYLTSNRELIRSGGAVHRVFICRESDLASRDFAQDLLDVVHRHRNIGVACGMAVFERIDPTHAVDFVVFAGAAVLIEEQQATVDYRTGRSTVQFKRVDGWTHRFKDLWEANRTPSASEQLAGYEAMVRRMLADGAWSAAEVREYLSHIDPG
ncbi:hypothetical protein AB0C12_00025 [Actinoplanes sp. NPDC048967]|uniref:hypothetical protein n=1 Tax=Actinoplanes sp. NPDC048967 TaxID=3155269 RepID=UPI0033F9BF2F